MHQENKAYTTSTNPQVNTIRRRRRSPAFVLALLLCATILIASIYVITSADDSYGNNLPVANYDNPQAAHDGYNPQTPALPTHANIQENNQAEPQVLSFEQLSEISNDHLLLINIDNAVPPYISGNLARISDYIRALNPDTLLDEYVLAMLTILFDSAADMGFTQFRVTQGFRTHEYQQALFDNASNQDLVALPGHSEHQVGLAVDISYEGVNIGNSVQGTWLMENSYRYGFILRYPQHKTEITGIPFEPWHYRYVGQPHAYFMTRNDLVLEEYINFLRAIGELTITLNGDRYRVKYLHGPGETIEIPANYTFWASLDNTGGIIVTLRRFS